MWVHSNPLMSHAGVTFISPPVVTPPPVAKSVSFTGYITLLRVRRLEMCLDPYKNWIQVDPIFEFLKLLLCCDVALSSPIEYCCDLSTIIVLHCQKKKKSIPWLLWCWFLFLVRTFKRDDVVQGDRQGRSSLCENNDFLVPRVPVRCQRDGMDTMVAYFCPSARRK